MKILAAFAICTCAWAQGIDRPQIGKMLDANGGIRPVYGIAASVSVGDVELPGVLSSGCSRKFCLAKTQTGLVSATRSVPAPAGKALFAFEGDAAWVWFVESRRLLEYSGGGMSACAGCDGEVLSIGAQAGVVEFAVRRRNGVWIVRGDGTVLDSLPLATGPVMLIPGGAVYATASEIVIRDVHFPLSGVTGFSQMSGDYLQVRAGGSDYALRIQKGHEALFQLPDTTAANPLAIYAVTATSTTPVGSNYSFGPVAVNTTSTVEFQVFNTGSTPVTVNVTLAGAGLGFTFTSPTLPYSILANSTATQTLNIEVRFAPTMAASYSASLQIGSVSVFLVGTGVVAPSLTSVSGCSGSGSFNWGSVTLGNAAVCNFALTNPYAQAITVASVVVNGLGFTGPYGITAPLTIQPGQTIPFSVNFTPPGAGIYSGTLAIGTESFALSGLGQAALLPTPMLQFDSGAFASGQQRVLTMTLPGVSPINATGYVSLAFTPSTGVVKDDAEIVFLVNGSRTIPFSVSAGSMQVLLNGLSSAAFQTGTTEGTITFTITTQAAMSGTASPVTISIPGAKAMIESATASNQSDGTLVISITGADNTYSAGMMSFAFFDTSGNAIGSAMNADFSSQFKSYFGMQTAGSAFLAQVTFPVTGSVAGIGSVTVTLTNAVGTVSTGSLTFQ
jgi:hypothetical protein